MELIQSLMQASGIKAMGGALGVMAGVWLLGLFHGSAVYKGLRDALGKFSENLGRQVSRLGNSKLKGLYEPLENIAVDFFLFMAEQFAVGLRKDNPQELEKHVERLEGVGSQTRVEAVKKKIEQAKGGEG